MIVVAFDGYESALDHSSYPIQLSETSSYTYSRKSALFVEKVLRANTKHLKQQKQRAVSSGIVKLAVPSQNPFLLYSQIMEDKAMIGNVSDLLLFRDSFDAGVHSDEDPCTQYIQLYFELKS
eukprot:99796_1